MNNFLKNITDGLIPSLTQTLTTAAQAAIDGANALFAEGAGVIRADGGISENPNSFGFAFEHLHAIGFNIRASLAGSDQRAGQIPADGTQHGPDIKVTDAIGHIIAQIQAKVGSAEYVSRQANNGAYQGQQVVTDAANRGIPNTDVVIEVGGIRSFPISLEFAKFVAQNPHLSANLMKAAAIGGEAISGGVTGAAINTSITLMLQSIQLAGAYCRGEAAFTPERMAEFQAQVLTALSSGFMRGVAVKLLQRLLGGNAFAALGFAIGAEAVPALIQILEGKLTVDKAIQQVGPRVLTAGMVTTVVLLFPPVGSVLFGATLLQAVWAEITPEYKRYFIQMVETTGKAAAAGVQAGQAHLEQKSWDLLGASSASAAASSAEMGTMQSELDALLE